MQENIKEKWNKIVSINKEIDDLYHKIADFYHFSDSAFWVLYSLYIENGNLTQKEICDNWAYSKQTINSAIKNLLEHAYIEMDKDKLSNHSKKIRLTKLGARICDKTIANVIKAEEESFSKVKEKDLDIVINILNSSYIAFKSKIEKINGGKDYE